MRELSNISNEVWCSKKEICDVCNVDEKTFRNFKKESNLGIDSQVKRNLRQGDRNVDYYPESILKQFQMWLMRNQTNQGRSSQVIKQATMDNLEIGVAANAVMSSGSVEAAEQFAQLLISRTAAVAENKRLEQANHQLQLENQQLVEENDYLKKANDYTTAQLGYYKKKYHSWYDDYENY